MIQKRPGTWRHWAIYDIPADRTKLAETPGPPDFELSFNDFRRPAKADLAAAAPRTAIIISGWRFRSSLALRGRPARMTSGKRASTSLPRPLAQSY